MNNGTIMNMSLCYTSNHTFFFLRDIWTYQCNEAPEVIGGHPVQGRCIKVLVSSLAEDDVTLDMNGCKLTCGQYGTLWPVPTGNVSISKKIVKNLVGKRCKQILKNPQNDVLLHISGARVNKI